MAAPRVAILTHLRQGLQRLSAVGRLMRTAWQPAGIDVVVQQGLRNPPQADLAILHVDLTVIPDEYLELGARYAHCLNLAVRDISKRRISRNLVTAADGYQGPVIVKTDLNYGGRPERALRLAEGGPGRRWRDVIERRLPSAWTGRLRDDGYQVYDRKGDVPGWVWGSPDLVVERLLADRQGDRCRMYQWYFFGDADCVVPVYGPGTFVDFQRQETLERQTPHREVPEEMRARRRELGFDFGKLDYVVRDGKAVLLDANRTPALDEPELGRTAMLAPGLWSFLETV
jgi:hypothetical protein